MHPIFLLVLSIFQFFHRQANCEEDYKIAVPEFICDKNGSVREIQSDITTIRILEKKEPDPDLTYNYNLKFSRTTENKCRNKQRCTLMAWRKIREFQKYLTDNRPEDGSIQFNNNMLPPDLKYTLNILVMHKNGSIVEEKQMNLDFMDEETKKTLQKPSASIILKGSNQTFAYSSYFLNAEVAICGNISDYYFVWKLSDESNSTLIGDFKAIKGAELIIPANTFQAGKIYLINCELIDAENAQTISKSVQKVSIAERGILLKLPFDYLITKANEAILIKAFVLDLDNQEGDIKISWTCEDEEKNPCNSNSDTNEFNLEGGLTEGLYSIAIEASKTSFTKSANCTIEIKEEAPPIEIETIPTPINPSSGFEIAATVHEVHTSCSLQWTSLPDAENFALNLSTVPGNVNVLYNITLREDLFLHELEEFSNSTVSRKFNLLIPPPEDKWGGLQGDKIYKFRLVVSCLPLLVDYEDNNDTEPVLAESIVTFADVSIESNAGPVLEKIEIQPIDGVAMETLFKFRTQKAKDKLEDEPVVYKFGFLINNREVIFAQTTDGLNVEGVLPYSDSGIETFLEGCDNFNSCSTIKGPKVMTKLPEKLDEKNFEKFYKNYLDRDEFYKSFTNALSVISLYENKSAILGRFYEDVDKKIEDLINAAAKNDINWSNLAYKLINIISEFDGDFKFPEAIINKLVKLRTELDATSREIISINNYRGRKLLSNIVNNKIDVGSIQSYLQISELIITSATSDQIKIEDEKENLRRKLVVSYLGALCIDLYKKEQIMLLELKTVIASVEKVTKNSYGNFFTIPAWNSNNAKIKLNLQISKLRPNRRFCIGKATFKEYLNKAGLIYFADVFDAETGQQLILQAQLNYLVILPVVNQTRNLKCMVYNVNNEWKDCTLMQVSQTAVQCSCKFLGYFYLFNDDKIIVTTQASTTTVEITESTINITLSTTPATTSEALKNSDKFLDNFETLSYIIIALSLIGVLILCIVLRRVSSVEDESNILMDNFDDIPKYATLHNEELLTGVI